MNYSDSHRARLVAYAEQVLQLDPERDAERIVNARITALEVGAAAATAEPDILAIRQNRQTAIDNLREVREQFWALSHEELDARLKQLADSDAPDLQSAIGRLQVVSRYRRQAFYELAENRAEESFANMLRDVFVASPRDSVDLKEAIRLAFRRPFWRRSRRRFLVRLRAEVRKLYELEADWIERALRQRPSVFPPRGQKLGARFAAAKQRHRQDDTDDEPAETPTRPIWLIAAPLYILILYLIRMMFP